MAQINTRVNTQTSLWPLLSQLQGSTLIDSRGDQTFIPNVNPSDQAGPVDRGNPQVYYCHNVMPSTYGLQSINFKQVYPGDPSNKFQKIKLITQTTDLFRTYIALDWELGKTVKILQQNGSWAQPVNAPTGLERFNQVSIATINGVSYICIAYKGVFTYTQGTNTLNPVTLNGLDSGALIGICAANGYLVAYSVTGVNWSATNDPLDFEPSQVTGAGGGSLQEARGPLVWMQETSYGAVIYTEGNAVSMTYTGNNTLPFNFKDISGSGGISDGDMVSQESTGTQYAYTTNGMQTIFHTGAKTVLAYITDFLGGKVFEDFNGATNQLEISTISSPLRKKITLINDRYLVVSYGLYQAAQFTHALILDTAQTRMGKVKIPHNAAFELKILEPEVGDTPRESIAFMDETGKVSVIDFNIMNNTGLGVMILGKYQYVRSNSLECQTVEVENAQTAMTMEVGLYSIMQKNLGPAYPSYLLAHDGISRTYSFPTAPVAKSFALLFKGSFNLISLSLNVNIHGRSWA